MFDQYGSLHKFEEKLTDETIQRGLKIVNLDNQKIEKLKMLLQDANCNSIGSGFKIFGNVNQNYASLGYFTNDLYGLNYVIFDKELASKDVKVIEGNCRYKAISSSVFVEYGGPAFGSDCFPDKK